MHSGELAEAKALWFQGNCDLLGVVPNLLLVIIAFFTRADISSIVMKIGIWGRVVFLALKKHYKT